MKRQERYSLAIVMVSVFTGGLFWQVSQPESALAAASFSVVVNEGVSATAVTQQDLENILLGNMKKWDDGTRIYIAVFKEGDLSETFLRQHAHKTLDQFDTYWKKQVFTGKGIAPKAVETEAEMIQYLAEQKGAIGYCSAEVSQSGVKPIEVQ